MTVKLSEKIFMVASISLLVGTSFGGTQYVNAAPISSKSVAALKIDSNNIIFEGTPERLANKQMYQVVDIKAGFLRSKMYADDVGGHLIVIDSDEENKMIATFLKEQKIKYAYIGVSDKAGKGNWINVNGDAIEYSNWRGGQPVIEKGTHSYVVIDNKGRWYSGSFSREVAGEKYGTAFIVEWDKKLDDAKYVKPYVEKVIKPAPTPPVTIDWSVGSDDTYSPESIGG